MHHTAFHEAKGATAERGAATTMARTKPQQTLATDISCAGVGLHSGATVNMTLRPAAPNTGIVFRRIDLAGEVADVDIPAHAHEVRDTQLGTTISNACDARVSTIEHLMAALAGCGIDNAIVELDAAEVPVMDGSSAPFVRLIECAGIEAQAAPRRYIRILSPVVVDLGDKRAVLEPHDGFAIHFQIDFPTPAIGRQDLAVELGEPSFKKDIAAARTFGFMKDVETLWSMGLAQGASLANTVAIDDDAVVNEDGLRFKDEFVRHKVLDAVGDLYLAGAPIIGRYRGEKAGHAVNNQLLRALFERPDAYEITTEAPAVEAVPVRRTGGAPMAASAAAAPA